METSLGVPLAVATAVSWGETEDREGVLSSMRKTSVATGVETFA